MALDDEPPKRGIAKKFGALIIGMFFLTSLLVASGAIFFLMDDRAGISPEEYERQREAEEGDDEGDGESDTGGGDRSDIVSYLFCYPIVAMLILLAAAIIFVNYRANKRMREARKKREEEKLAAGRGGRKARGSGVGEGGEGRGGRAGGTGSREEDGVGDDGGRVMGGEDDGARVAGEDGGGRREPPPVGMLRSDGLPALGEEAVRRRGPEEDDLGSPEDGLDEGAGGAKARGRKGGGERGGEGRKKKWKRSGRRDLRCPDCGGSRLVYEAGFITGQYYLCKDCQYRGAFVIEMDPEDHGKKD